MDDVRALTIRQPWAQLIMMGRKRIETRSMRTNRTGRIYIHAATTMGPVERAAAIREGLDPDALPRGCIVGTATIDHSTPVEDFHPLAVSDAERRRGDFSEGRWGWVLSDVRAIETPIPASGSLSFWQVPADVVDAVEEQLPARVFVYGTLKKGFSNHRLLTTGARFIGNDQIAGTMHDYGYFPAVSLTDRGLPVHGEVYEVTSSTLERLDRLEGIPTFYQRTRVRMSTGREAWVYSMEARALAARTVVATGRWEKR